MTLPHAARRVVTLACLILPLLLVGAPEFTALQRAVSKAFIADTDVETVAAAARKSTEPEMIVAGVRRDRPTLATSVTDAAQPAPFPRRGVLMPLYASFVTLQALDLHSTLLAIHRGASEANPVMAGFADHPPALVAVKVGSAVGILFMAERVRRHSRVGAIVMMAALNTAYATVVVRNYHIAGRLAQ